MPCFLGRRERKLCFPQRNGRGRNSFQVNKTGRNKLTAMIVGENTFVLAIATYACGTTYAMASFRSPFALLRLAGCLSLRRALRCSQQCSAITGACRGLLREFILSNQVILQIKTTSFPLPCSFTSSLLLVSENILVNRADFCSFSAVEHCILTIFVCPTENLE